MNYVGSPQNKRLLLTIGAWWPAAGWRTNNSGAIGDVGGYAYYWSSTRSGTYNSYNLNFNYNGGVNPSNNNNRSFGFSVRCVQDFTADTNYSRALHFAKPLFSAST